MSELVMEQNRDGVAQLTLNRPEVYNALDLVTARALSERLLVAASDPAVRVVVITGAGRAFSAGGDLRGVGNHAHGLPGGFRELATHVHGAVTEIRRMPKPVIAAVNGVAAGGGFSLALACDLRIMSRSARLIQGYTSQGLAIDAGGTFTLPRLVGLARALEIAAFDEPIPAETALDWGLVNRVVDTDALDREAWALAERLAARSVHAFAAVKRLLTDSFDSGLEVQLEREREALVRCAAHPDGQEGVRAFVAKRPPSFAPPGSEVPPA